tara:strand:+ start:493 stop:1101 length:609 start_codon:yes stop_codon:yes gene_type:complete
MSIWNKNYFDELPNELKNMIYNYLHEIQYIKVMHELKCIVESVNSDPLFLINYITPNRCHKCHNERTWIWYKNILKTFNYSIPYPKYIPYEYTYQRLYGHFCKCYLGDDPKPASIYDISSYKYARIGSVNMRCADRGMVNPYIIQNAGWLPTPFSYKPDLCCTWPLPYLFKNSDIILFLQMNNQKVKHTWNKKQLIKALMNF